MEIVGRSKLEKLKRKNKGNTALCNAIDELLALIEISNWTNQNELKKDRPEADKVHRDDFYFFNIEVHRTMILVEFDDGEATVVWCGSHDEYEQTFKNNKNTINKWLKNKGWVN